MSNNSKILLMCALVFTVACTFAIVDYSRKSANAIAEVRRARLVKRSHRNAANNLVHMKMMSSDEAVKFQDITTEVTQTHAISDDDLDWMLTLINKPESTPGYSTQMHYLVLGTLEYIKTTTPQQQDKVFSVLLPLLTGSESLDKTSADLTLVAFNVTKAVPYIQVQLHDPNPSVVAGAKNALSKLAP